MCHSVFDYTLILKQVWFKKDVSIWNSDTVDNMNDWMTMSLRLERVLIVAGVVLLLCILACVLWLRQFPLDQGYWVSGPDDDYAQLLTQVESITVSSKPALVVVGSSALREALTTVDELKRDKPEYDWNLLTAGDLFLVEAAQVVAALPRELSGVLLIEASMRLLSTSPETTQQLLSKPRFPIQNWRFMMQMMGLGYTPSLGLGQVSFYLSRWDWFDPQVIPREQWLFHQVDYIDLDQIDLSRSGQKGENWLDDLPLYVHNNLTIFNVIQTLAPPKMSVGLIHSPRNPEWQDALEKHPSWSEYQQTLTMLESDFIGTILEIDNGVGSQHFLDHGHIRTLKGRQIATANFLRNLEEGQYAR